MVLLVWLFTACAFVCRHCDRVDDTREKELAISSETLKEPLHRQCSFKSYLNRASCMWIWWVIVYLAQYQSRTAKFSGSQRSEDNQWMYFAKRHGSCNYFKFGSDGMNGYFPVTTLLLMLISLFNLRHASVSSSEYVVLESVWIWLFSSHYKTIQILVLSVLWLLCGFLKWLPSSSEFSVFRSIVWGLDTVLFRN